MRSPACSSRVLAGVAAVAAALALTSAAVPAQAASPVVRVMVTARPASVASTGTSAKPTDLVVVVGKVTPASGRVVLQRRAGRTWQDEAGATVAGHTGRFRLVARHLPVGVSSLRVVRAATHGTRAVASPPFSVTVHAPRSTTASIPAQPAPVPPAPSAAEPPVVPVSDPPVPVSCRISTVQGPAGIVVVGLIKDLGYVGRFWSGGLTVVDDRPSTVTVLSPLPPGITQKGSGFVGTPTAAGIFTTSLLVTDQGGATIPISVCMQFVQPLTLVTPTLPTGTTGQAYDEPLELAGGFLPIYNDFSSQSALVGAGLGMSVSYDITGTPSYSGPRAFRLQLVDGAQITTDLMVTVPMTTVGSPRVIDVPGGSATIQDAIDQAEPGDTVLVAPGIYTENIDFKGKAITVTSSQGPAHTVIDGGALGSTVNFRHEEPRQAVLSGFTIRNGLGGGGDVASGVDVQYGTGGGGVDIEDASPTIEDNLIIGNTGVVGSGVAAVRGSPLIRDNTISGNTDTSGSVDSSSVYVRDTVNATVTGNTIENSAWGYDGSGRGVVLGGTDTLFQSNVVSGNLETQGASALQLDDGVGMRIVDNLLTDNVGPEVVDVNGNVDSLQVSFVGNTIDGNAGIGIALENGFSQVTFTDTVLSGSGAAVLCLTPGVFAGDSGATFSHDDFAGVTVPAACGAFNAQLGDTSATPTYDPGGWVPAAGSSLVDAGASDAALPATDLAGQPRVADGDRDGTATVDIGAYERP